MKRLLLVVLSVLCVVACLLVITVAYPINRFIETKEDRARLDARLQELRTRRNSR